MKRIMTLSLAALSLFLCLSACSNSAGQPSESPSMTPEEYAQAYKAAIEGARDEETNEYLPVITAASDDMADLILPMLGITDENAAAYAVSVSPMNIRAYGVAAILPADGSSQEILDGVNGFVETQRANFEFYLADQYEIAQSAKVETLDDGTILLVMCEDQDTVFDSIKSALG